MEDRRYPRVDIDEPIGIHAGDYYRVEKGRQISEGGLLFESKRPFPQGERISMTFQLSDKILMKFEGEVAYIIEPVPGKILNGVRFIGANADHIKMVVEYFRKRGSC